MNRWKALLCAVVTVAIAGGIFVAVPPSSSAASQTHFALGRIAIADAGSLDIVMRNPTDKVVIASPSIVGPLLHFTPGGGTDDLAPGEVVIASFGCADNPDQACAGNPEVASSSKSLIVSARYVPAGGTVPITAFAGEWVTYKG